MNGPLGHGRTGGKMVRRKLVVPLLSLVIAAPACIREATQSPIAATPSPTPNAKPQACLEADRQSRHVILQRAAFARTVRKNSGPIEADPGYQAVLQILQDNPGVSASFSMTTLDRVVSNIKARRKEAIASRRALLDAALQVYGAFSDACSQAMSSGS